MRTKKRSVSSAASLESGDSAMFYSSITGTELHPLQHPEVKLGKKARDTNATNQVVSSLLACAPRKSGQTREGKFHEGTVSSQGEIPEALGNFDMISMTI